MARSSRGWTGPLIDFLLSIYPKAFRREQGGAVRQTYEDVLEDRGATPRTLTWLIFDAVTTGARLRADGRRRRRSNPQRGGGGEMMRRWGSELLLAVRSLARAPVFATVVIVTMALGIGANTAVFSVVYRVLLEPLPFDEPNELVWIQNRYLPRGNLGAVSVPEFWEFRQNQPALEGLSAFSPDQANLTGPDVPIRLEGLVVSPGYFDLLGRQPSLGRGFLPEEEEPGRGAVTIISHSLWQSAFGSDPSILGRPIELDGEPVTVVGVMGPDFESMAPFVFPGAKVDYWLPRTIDPGAMSIATVERHNIWVVGRLADGADRGAAENGLLAAMRRVERTYPDISSAGSRDVLAIPMRERVAGDVQGVLVLISMAVLLLLVLTTVNITNMLVVRAEARTGETAVRAALGASRSGLLAYGMSESVVIGLAGGAVGLGFAALALRALPAFANELGVVGGDLLGGSVVFFSFALAVFAGVVTGAIPALRAARGDVFASLKTSSGRAGAWGRRSLRNALVAGQIAGTVVLVSGAALVLRSVAGLRDVDPGFRTENLSLVRINAMSADYGTMQSVQQLYQELEARLESVPGVASVAASWQTPLQSGMSDLPIHPEVAEDTDWRRADPNWITPGYFETYGIGLVEGRVFDRSDLERDVGAVVLGASAAREMWPGESAVGKRVNVNYPNATWREVIGVVEDVHNRGLRDGASLQWYMTMAPGPLGPMANLTLSVASNRSPEEVRQSLVQALAAIDPGIPVGPVVTIEDQISRTLVVERLLTWTLGFFGGLSLVLGTMGVYGLVSYSVQMRQREIGLRIAMGAERSGVLRLVLRQGAKLAAVGALVGLGGALLSGRLLEGFLFGVSGRDLATLGGVGTLVVLTTILAAYLPARRAATIDPLKALRAE